MNETEKFTVFLREWNVGLSHKAYVLARSSIGRRLGYDADDFMSDFQLVLLSCIRKWKVSKSKNCKFSSFFWTQLNRDVGTKALLLSMKCRTGTVFSLDQTAYPFLGACAEELDKYKFYVREFTGIMRCQAIFNVKERNLLDDFIHGLSEGYTYVEIANKLQTSASSLKLMDSKMSKTRKYKSYKEELANDLPRNAVLSALAARVVCPAFDN